jgi:single-stranded DNA-specific DHH superfamily exonuclease
MIDTVLFPHERNYEELSEIENLAPFWEGNNEPNFLFENIIVERVEKVWKNWWAHLKIFWKFWDEHLAIVFWWRWEESEKIKDKISLVWNVKRDTYNWWFYIHGVDWIE